MFAQVRGGVRPGEVASSHGPPKDAAHWPAIGGRRGLQRAEAFGGSQQASVGRAVVGQRAAAEPIVPHQGRGRPLPVGAARRPADRRAVRRRDRRARVVAAAARPGPGPRVGPDLAGGAVERVGAPDPGVGRRGAHPAVAVARAADRALAARRAPRPPPALAAAGRCRRRREVSFVAGAVEPPARTAQPARARHRRPGARRRRRRNATRPPRPPAGSARCHAPASAERSTSASSTSTRGHRRPEAVRSARQGGRGAPSPSVPCPTRTRCGERSRPSRTTSRRAARIR